MSAEPARSSLMSTPPRETGEKEESRSVNSSRERSKNAFSLSANSRIKQWDASGVPGASGSAGTSATSSSDQGGPRLGAVLPPPLLMPVIHGESAEFTHQPSYTVTDRSGRQYSTNVDAGFTREQFFEQSRKRKESYSQSALRKGSSYINNPGDTPGTSTGSTNLRVQVPERGGLRRMPASTDNSNISEDNVSTSDVVTPGNPLSNKSSGKMESYSVVPARTAQFPIPTRLRGSSESTLSPSTSASSLTNPASPVTTPTSPSQSTTQSKKKNRPPSPPIGSKRKELLAVAPLLNDQGLSLASVPEHHHAVLMSVDVTTVMKRGCALIKYGRVGAPHTVDFKLTADAQAITWQSKKKSKKPEDTLVRWEWVTEIRFGQNTKTFQKFTGKRNKELAGLSFSLVYYRPKHFSLSSLASGGGHVPSLPFDTTGMIRHPIADGARPASPVSNHDTSTDGKVETKGGPVPSSSSSSSSPLPSSLLSGLPPDTSTDTNQPLQSGPAAGGVSTRPSMNPLYDDGLMRSARAGGEERTLDIICEDPNEFVIWTQGARHLHALATNKFAPPLNESTSVILQLPILTGYPSSDWIECAEKKKNAYELSEDIAHEEAQLRTICEMSTASDEASDSLGVYSGHPSGVGVSGSAHSTMSGIGGVGRIPSHRALSLRAPNVSFSGSTRQRGNSTGSSSSSSSSSSSLTPIAPPSRSLSYKGLSFAQDSDIVHVSWLAQLVGLGPLQYSQVTWQRIFSLDHGADQRTLFRSIQTSPSQLTLTVIQDSGYRIFGGLGTSAWSPVPSTTCGTNQCYVFAINTEDNQLHAYKWAGRKENMFFQYTSHTGFGFGGISMADYDRLKKKTSQEQGTSSSSSSSSSSTSGSTATTAGSTNPNKETEEKGDLGRTRIMAASRDDYYGAALYVDDHLLKGTSTPCPTYNSPTLSHATEFDILNYEVWSPVNAISVSSLVGASSSLSTRQAILTSSRARPASPPSPR